jgi:uncharacterized membrane protein
MGDFRIGRIFDRTTSTYTRNFLPFSLVALIAAAPPLLLTYSAGLDPTSVAGARGGMFIVTIVLSVVLGLLSQAILVYAAFQDMRDREVNISESLNVALSRFFPILGLAILTAIGVGIGFMLLLIPGLILMTMWFVGVPACMVDRLGPWDSLKRSAQLTKGYRWKLFGIMLLLYVGAGIVSQVITVTMVAIGGLVVGLITTLIWNMIWGAFFATFVVVTYYELRSAKEGIGIEQIASVFD